VNKQITNFFPDKILTFIIFFFPLIIVLKSAAINTATTIVSIIILFYIFKNWQINFYRTKLVTYIIIFFSFIFINSIINFKSFDILLKSIANFRYLFLSLAVFFVLKKISDLQRKFFIYFNIILVFFIILDIFYQFIFYKDIFGYPPGMCNQSTTIKCLRFAGVFNDELIAGSYLSQIGVLILILFLNLNKIYSKFLIKIFLYLFLITIILLTGERAALLIMIIFFFFNFFFQKKIINFFFLLIFLFTLVFFSSKRIESVNSRFVHFFDGWRSISEKHTGIINKTIESPWSYHYQAAIELFLQKPILGHGPKSFRVKCENTDIDKKVKQQADYYGNYRACSTHPHNYLLEFLSENGTVGGLFFIGLIYIVFSCTYKKCKNKKDENMPIFIGIGSLILAIVFPFKPSGSFFTTFNASMLFYIFGFFLYYLNKVK
jgi:O-antigen ligase